MLNGKMYVAWEPTIIQAALKSKNLSTNPLIKTVTGPLTSLSPIGHGILTGEHGDEVVDKMIAIMAPALRGESLQPTVKVALDIIGDKLSDIAVGGIQEDIPDLWAWIQKLTTDATSTALYGDENPFAKHPGLDQALWDFEANMLKLAVNVLPGVIAPTGVRARSALINALEPFYKNKLDAGPTASEICRKRGDGLREGGIPDGDVARIEMLLPFAAFTNSVPTLFWFISYVVTRPGLVTQLRSEIEKNLITRREGDEVTLYVGPSIEERCPLLWACYRETLRLAVHQVFTRTVLKDTTVADGNGQEYLLKEGTVLQMPIRVVHNYDQYWGDDVTEFNPKRFLNASRKSAEEPGSVKAIRQAWLPFGSGTHLCPGRHFAHAELMSVVAPVVLAYDAEPLGGRAWKLPSRAVGSLIDAVTKPAEGTKEFGIKLKRRQGWESVRWKLEV